ncbi:MAG: hypothetical protein RL328_2752 [Acidobacteriota bacterium]|jgi:hypothetical protein
MKLVSQVVNISLALALAAAAVAQTPAAGAPGNRPPAKKADSAVKSVWPPTGPTPRTADGHPDMTGNWQPNAINENVDLAGRVDVPMLPWAQAVYEKRKADISKDDPEALCLPPGVPRMSTTPYPWTILQTPQFVAFLYEGGAHVWRKVFMGRQVHDPIVEQTWLGDSIGWWEGDTLVIETVGQTEKSWLDQSGVPHSNDMKVTERITRNDFGHMTIEHIIEDPKTFSRPWSFTTHPTLLKGELIEYICQENNRDVEHLVGK